MAQSPAELVAPAPMPARAPLTAALDSVEPLPPGPALALSPVTMAGAAACADFKACNSAVVSYTIKLQQTINKQINKLPLIKKCSLDK